MALDDLTEALGVGAGEGTGTGEAWRLIGRVHRLMDQFDLAFEAFEKAEQDCDPETNADAWVALQVEVANAMYFGGRARQIPDLIERVGPQVERYGTPAQRAELVGFSAFHRFISERFRLSDETLEVCRRALELAAAGDDRRQRSDARFRMGFALLWADRVTEAVGHLEQAVVDARRLGDVMAETRATGYLAIARRRSGDVDAALESAIEALDVARQLGETYYQGHALAVLGWAHWRKGAPVDAEEALGRAIELWGLVDRDGETFANVEFSWLAAWPLCAIAHDRGDVSAATGHLAWLDAPWERPMADELGRAVHTARTAPSVETVAAAIEVAEAERLL